MFSKTTPLALGLGALVAQPALGAAFFDDFSSDTSLNYTGTVTYGGAGGGFDVTGGTLNVDASGGRTFDVFHNTANLEAGEYVSVDVLPGQPTNFYLAVSTTTRHPGTGSEDGIRLGFTDSNTLVSRPYEDGSSPGTIAYAPVLADTEVTMYILRNTDTSFSVGYDDGGGFTVLDTYTLAAVGSQDLFIGVEDFGSTMSFDNLTIGDIAEIPEPGSLALLGLSAMAMLRRRRA
ncbi:MAG: PEP-CTERM sorting domain-containing protein [Phycisphaerales bacterium JB063]